MVEVEAEERQLLTTERWMRATRMKGGSLEVQGIVERPSVIVPRASCCSSADDGNWQDDKRRVELVTPCMSRAVHLSRPHNTFLASTKC